MPRHAGGRAQGAPAASRMFLVDTAEHRIVDDDGRDQRSPTRWPGPAPPMRGGSKRLHLRHAPGREHVAGTPHPTPACRSARSATPTRTCAGPHRPMALGGNGPSARWAPTRRSRCSADRARVLFDYFAQLFAQVTNPPIDAIREELVTSLAMNHDRPRGQTCFGDAGALPPGAPPFPVIDNDELAKILRINLDGDLPGRNEPRARSPASTTSTAAAALEARLADLRRGSRESATGVRFVILSDRRSTPTARRSVAARTSAVHHHLVRGAHQGRSHRRDRRRARGARV